MRSGFQELFSRPAGEGASADNTGFSFRFEISPLLILILIKKQTKSTFYSAVRRVEDRMRRHLRKQMDDAIGGISSIKSSYFLWKNSISDQNAES